MDFFMWMKLEEPRGQSSSQSLRLSKLLAGYAAESLQDTGCSSLTLCTSQFPFCDAAGDSCKEQAACSLCTVACSKLCSQLNNSIATHSALHCVSSTVSALHVHIFLCFPSCQNCVWTESWGNNIPNSRQLKNNSPGTKSRLVSVEKPILRFLAGINHCPNQPSLSQLQCDLTKHC